MLRANEQSIKNFLGIIKKSGKLSTGMDKVKESIEKGECKLLIYARDTGINTFDKAKTLTKNSSIELIEWGDKKTLGETLGTKPVAIVAIKDKKFAEKLCDLFFKNNRDDN